MTGHVKLISYILHFLGKPKVAVYQYLVPILSLATDSLLFLNQQKKVPPKNVPDERVNLEDTCIQRGYTTDQATMPSTCKCEDDPIKIHYLFPKMSLEAHQFYHCKWFKRCLVGWLIDS